MTNTDPYIFDDDQEEKQPQITESFLDREFGSLLDFDELDCPEARQLNFNEE